MHKIVFVDSEISLDGKLLDLGAIGDNGDTFHSSNESEFAEFVSKYDYVCGHNIFKHDLKYIKHLFNRQKKQEFIDTLLFSPLLFPKKPYHKLLKDDKLTHDEFNNPLNDAIKARDLFYDEMNAYIEASRETKWFLCSLLFKFEEFKSFFTYQGFKAYPIHDYDIRRDLRGKICDNADLSQMIEDHPIELAYAYSIIKYGDRESVTPPWVMRNYPVVGNIIKLLQQTPCEYGCRYCNSVLDAKANLKRFFNYDKFRKFNGEPLQEKAACAAIKGESLLAIFPTGGGKSLTFQLPALMAGENGHGLTVIISPLQSLMKDQVDNLEKKGIADAVTINGLLDPIERASAIERVFNGQANLLYISPEQLRSRTIERLLSSRNVVRFVIDEAHCFSAWGQDFRVDYLYIGDFIKKLQQVKGNTMQIAVSCFTATAKQKVIIDILDYFKKKLDLELKLFTTSATRQNLRYTVLYKETEDDKYNTLRALISSRDCPTIVYVSRTRRTLQLATKLTNDGFPALPFNGKMDPSEKIVNQEAFIKNDVKVIVATSAFGMGVDKSDVKLVVHYDISDSLENYVQEAGRAGRDESIQAECFVLFNDEDLNKHFILLNQTKLSLNEIQCVWKAIKKLTEGRNSICCSALEIARAAGWDDTVSDIDTRVKTAISSLETAGYIVRGKNVPRVYATSILAHNMREAAIAIDETDLLDADQKKVAKRVIGSLISSKYISKAGNDDAESRVDYLADRLGIDKREIINAINVMRQIGVLADTQDMTAFIKRYEEQNRSNQILERFAKLEAYMLEQIPEEGVSLNLKELNDSVIKEGCNTANIKDIKKIIFFWTIQNYIKKSEHFSQSRTDLYPTLEVKKLKSKLSKRLDISQFILQELYNRSISPENKGSENVLVRFSLVELLNLYNETPHLSIYNEPIVQGDIEDALLYLSKIGALSIEGGFLVSYNGMEIKRLVMDNKIRYKSEDYRTLNDFYKHKIQQIHIVGEYANLMVKDYSAALRFVSDYFQMDFKKFISKYFKGQRAAEIERGITADKYKNIFGELSEEQLEIINDDASKFIVVAAGPGSGKTRVLVHKLASLLMLEDVKHEQLLMVTFSRTAATEFKKRLISLIGNAANFVEIKTFHSYCFDLLGKIGSLKDSEDVVKDAAEMIYNGEVETGRITKAVLVIDEAQDMDVNEFNLIKAMISRNEDIRVIAVGDDDQNVFAFKGASSKYLRSLVDEYGATLYEMVKNYRSKSNIVALANWFAQKIPDRMKRTPCEAVQQDKGVVRLIKHKSANMGQRVVNDIVSRSNTSSICILTNTNDEAYKMVGLLARNNIRAKLIQSLDGFKLHDIKELKFFLSSIDCELTTPVISDELWKRAKQKLKGRFRSSSCLDNCMKLIEDFETTNKTKYRTDLQEFINDSKYEDFYRDEKDTILVSTIHKSKGREFDCVYMVLDNIANLSEDDLRALYVGITRAKNELYIHYTGTIFDDIDIEDVEQNTDDNEYDEPIEIIKQLSHKDVFLDYFKDKQQIIDKLFAGQELEFYGDCLAFDGQRVLSFSKACMDHFVELCGKGYVATKAKIQFIVYWKGKYDDNETAIILPEITFVKEY